MTRNQALKAMRKRYPEFSISVTEVSWDHNHRDGISTEYSVYAGDVVRAHAGGSGDTLQEAFDNCAEYPADEVQP